MPSAPTVPMGEELDELADELPGFEFQECLGKGGMGVVWRARERVLDRHVAIKLVRNQDHDAAFVERFTREARVMARLHHPHIVTLFAFGRTRSNHCYLVMELVEGEDLTHLMARGPLDVPLALSIVTAVCEALHAAHREGFVHRDIKPGNVLLDERQQVKVGDFGLARLSRPLDPSTLAITAHGVAVGTPHYMAPEQARGKGGEDHRADIYSLGVMLYEMLTGELPRGLFQPPSKKRKLDRRIDTIVMRCLNEDPALRYDTVAALAADVARVRERVDPAMIAEQMARNHANRWRRRGELLLATAVSVVIGIICAWYAREIFGAGQMAQAGVQRIQRAISGGPLPDGGVTVHPATRLSGLNLIKVASEVRLQPSGLAANAYFGRQVTLWRDWLLVAADRDHDGGALYAYRRRADGWHLAQVIRNPRPGVQGAFGNAFAVTDERLVVTSFGSSGTEDSLDVLRFDPGADKWLFLPELHLGPQSLPRQVQSVAAAGNFVLLDGGASERMPRLFTLDSQGTLWTARSLPTRPEFHVGCVTIMNGETALIGGWRRAGAISTVSLTVAGLRDNVLASISPGLNNAPSAEDCQAIVSGSGRVFLGSPNADDRTGACWTVRQGEGLSWPAPIMLRPDPEDGKCRFGKSIAVRGNLLAVGADHYRASAENLGMVRLYRMSEDSALWPSERLVCDPELRASDFGNSVCIDDKAIVVGAPKSTDINGSRCGAVFIYELVAAP